MRRAGVIPEGGAKLAGQLNRPLADHLEECDLQLQANSTTIAIQDDRDRRRTGESSMYSSVFDGLLFEAF